MAERMTSQPESPERDDRELSTGRKVGVLVGGACVVIILVLFGISLQALISSPAPAPAPLASDIVLEPANTPGEDPFTPSVAAPADPSIASGGPGPTSAAAGSASPGDTRALYADLAGVAVADPATLRSTLHADQAKAQAWARAEGIAVGDLDSLLSRVTPVLLRQDIRVTDYSWHGGQAVAHQAVLQAGSAVWVDELGRPRVRAASGSPLASSTQLAPPLNYTGPSWPGFSPTTLDVITPATQPINQFVLYDPSTGQKFARPAGTSGTLDSLAAVPPDPVPPVSGP
jgi:hypothetical protein